MKWLHILTVVAGTSLSWQLCCKPVGKQATDRFWGDCASDNRPDTALAVPTNDLQTSIHSFDSFDSNPGVKTWSLNCVVQAPSSKACLPCPVR